MTSNDYQKLAQRTVMIDVEQMNKINDELVIHPNLSHVIIASLKLNSESGELADSLVKHFCYGQPLDVDNIKEECGDLLWYIALILTKLEYTLEDCMVENLAKLQKRYPEKFTEQHAALRLDKQ